MTTSTFLENLEARPPMDWLRERDIDLLVCSELHIPDSPLRQLLIGGWNDGVADFVGSWVSWRHNGREIDIVSKFSNGSHFLVLLIEDKIDAPFQSDQPEFYRKTAQQLKDSLPPGSEVQTVLLAPEAYSEIEGSELFDRKISYEDVFEALDKSYDTRTRFLSQTLQDGVESHRQGYVKQHDEARTRLWYAIWEVASKEFPELVMPKPDSKGAKSGFIRFKGANWLANAEARTKVEVIYKLNSWDVDLQFGGTSVAMLQSSVGHLLVGENGDMEVEQATGSASIRIKVPVVDLGRAPDEQEDAIRQGLQAAERLRKFFIECRPLDLIPSP